MHKSDQIAAQRDAGATLFADEQRWQFHHTGDPLTRYVRDRRLLTALRILNERQSAHLQSSVLVVCGGVGGEGSFFANRGYADVTVSDISPLALEMCERLDPRLKTLELNAESMNLPDKSFDLVVVQDGLHHLPRPVLGLTEMLRVSRRGVVVIEPHYGCAGNLIGTRWERHGDTVNFVFRWSRQSFEQVVRSYLLSDEARVTVRRMWDHSTAIRRPASAVPERLRPWTVRSLYATLTLAERAGNMFVGVVELPASD
ncbi:MAG: class I SAM-dependent methyltransferase [Candidatus Nanopelagicales bacterium]|nr:class I SAM-dependent methyltransferase [Candidatus Nanopelagicales bacterium]